jgi:predicted RNase H-like HicB family nuclease
MRYQVILFDGEDGFIIADCPSLPGCMSQGRTREEALANIREAMEAWLEVDAEEKGTAALPEPRIVEVTEVEVAA